MDSFKIFSLKLFKELNSSINESFENLNSTGLDKSLNNILHYEESLREIDCLTDSLVNKIVYLQQSQLIDQKLNMLNK